MGRKSSQKKKGAKNRSPSPEPEVPTEAPEAPRTPTKAGPSNECSTPTPPPRGSSKKPLAVSPLHPSPPLALPYHIRRSFSDSGDLEELDPFIERTKTKRNFSEASALSAKQNASKEMKTAREGDTEALAQLAFSNSLRVLTAHLESLEAEYDEGQESIRLLIKAWNAGTLDTTYQSYHDQLQKLDQRVGDLLVKMLTIRTSKYTMAGKVVDAKLLHDEQDTEDWSYIDQLIWRFREPEGGKWTMKFGRDDDQQARWRKALIKAYDAYDEAKDGLWCPIKGAFQLTESIKAAHIVRHNVPEWSAGYLFGKANDSTGHIWSLQNGILLTAYYEEMLDSAQIAIVPTGNEQELQVIVLDDSEAVKDYPESLIPKGKNLHKRILKFRNDHRPAMRYLYFTFAMNVLRRQRHEVPGWWRDRMKFGIGQQIWASPGSCLKAGMLRKLARRVGHVCEDDADSFWGSPTKLLASGAKTTGAQDDALDANREGAASDAIELGYHTSNAK